MACSAWDGLFHALLLFKYIEDKLNLTPLSLTRCNMPGSLNVTGTERRPQGAARSFAKENIDERFVSFPAVACMVGLSQSESPLCALTERPSFVPRGGLRLPSAFVTALFRIALIAMLCLLAYRCGFGANGLVYAKELAMSNGIYGVLVSAWKAYLRSRPYAR
jgi:hypothetical protein